MNLTRHIRLSGAQWALIGATAALAVVGYFLFSRFEDYTFLSDDNVDDILIAKLWTISWLALSALLIYVFRKKPFAPSLTVFALSAYFVGYFGILFSGTEYGMNGHWGDNGNRFAEICKMMAYGSFFQDWYLKDMPSFYPPLWFAIMALYAKALSIEAYQTVKWGYLLVVLVYPWLLYSSWIRLVGRVTAAIITVTVIFVGYKYLNWIYYEHMTAALFLPWWLYYFEDAHNTGKTLLQRWKFYLFGGLFGALIFMTYYYWFFYALVALPLTLGVRYLKHRSLRDLSLNIRHKALLMSGVALFSAVYWLPLMRSIYQHGMESAQNIWFHLGHANLTQQWSASIWEAVFTVAGVSSAAYFWNRWERGKIILLFIGAALLFPVDWLMAVGETSIQARKILEFAHVFAFAPLAIGAHEFWRSLKSPNQRYAIAAGAILVLVVFSNSHTQIAENKKYRFAVNQRVPATDLDVFSFVECEQKVFLTSHYLEACYIPYYLFIPLNNMTAHTAGRYSQRRTFLDRVSLITEPDLLAYALAYNRYSGIDYVYVPLDDSTGNLQLTLNVIRFNKKDNLQTIKFSVAPESAPNVFIKRHARGLYELRPAARSPEMDQRLETAYPEIWWHLQPREWTRKT